MSLIGELLSVYKPESFFIEKKVRSSSILLPKLKKNILAWLKISYYYGRKKKYDSWSKYNSCSKYNSWQSP